MRSYDYPDDYYISVPLSKPIRMKTKEGVDPVTIGVVEVIPIEDIYESHYQEITTKLKDGDEYGATVSMIKSTIRNAETGQPLNDFAKQRLTMRHIREISETISEGLNDPNE